MSQFPLPVTTSFLISTETLKIKNFSLTTFVSERFISGYRFPIDWTLGIPQPEKRSSKHLKLDYYRKQLLSLLPGSCGIQFYLCGAGLLPPSAYIDCRDLPKKIFKTVSTESMSTRCLPGFTENFLADWAFESFV